jgi:hypothetical protein
MCLKSNPVILNIVTNFIYLFINTFTPQKFEPMTIYMFSLSLFQSRPPFSSFKTWNHILHKVTRQVPFVEQILFTSPEYRNTWVHPFFLLGLGDSIFSFLCSVLQIIVSVFVIFFWQLYCLFIFNYRLLITLCYMYIV